MNKRSISLDPINPRDLRVFKVPVACEDCSHFDPKSESCTIGYNAENHRRKAQMKRYELSGRMAFCRCLEID